MIILRQKRYGLTNDGGGTSSMDFYKTMMSQYKSSGGKDYLGMSLTDYIKQRAASGDSLANQSSNLTDKSAFSGSVLQAGGTAVSTPKPSAMQQSIQNTQQHISNPNRLWADSIKNRNLRKQEQAFKKGQSSVGMWQGAKNSWKNMGTGAKWATGLAGAAALTGGAMLMKNMIKNKRRAEEAEEKLDEERLRRRR